MDKTLYSPEHEIFLDLLRKIRVDADLRQDDVAERLDKPQSFVSKYESGERRLDVLELREICAALDTTLARFVAELERKISK